MTFLRKLFGLPEKIDGVEYTQHARINTCNICNTVASHEANECLPPLESEGAIYDDLGTDGQYNMIVVLSCRKCGTLVKYEGTANRITTFNEEPEEDIEWGTECH